MDSSQFLILFTFLVYILLLLMSLHRYNGTNKKNFLTKIQNEGEKEISGGDKWNRKRKKKW